MPRKKGPEGIRKTKFLMVRVKEFEHKKFKEIALAKGQSISELLKYCIKYAMKNDFELRSLVKKDNNEKIH